MRYITTLMVLLLAASAACAQEQINDPPDTSHTNSGKAYFDKQGRYHVRPPYIVDSQTPEQHAAARAAHDAYFARINADRRAMLDAMTPAQRHTYICENLAEEIRTAAGLPPLSEVDQTFTNPLYLYRQEGCQ